MSLFQRTVLVIWFAVASNAMTDDADDNNNDLVNYHKENQHTYEILAAISLSSMVLILIVAFCGGCYFKNFFWMSESLDASEHSMTTSTAPMNPNDTTSASPTTTTGTKRLQAPITSNFTLISTLQKCLDVYCEQNGNVDIPDHFIIPSCAPWPLEAWGIDFGILLTTLQSSLSSGGIRSYNSEVSLSQTSHSSHDEHRAETWYELFYDLVFVAAALQLGMIIKYDHRIVGIVKAAILFLMLRSTWDHLTAYQNRCNTFLLLLLHYPCYNC